jgi:hypothetical protein
MVLPFKLMIDVLGMTLTERAHTAQLYAFLHRHTFVKHLRKKTKMNIYKHLRCSYEHGYIHDMKSVRALITKTGSPIREP